MLGTQQDEEAVRSDSHRAAQENSALSPDKKPNAGVVMQDISEGGAPEQAPTNQDEEAARCNTHQAADENLELSPVKELPGQEAKVAPESQAFEITEEKEPGLKRQPTAKELEQELKSGGPCGKNCYWISASLMAGACMGTGAFIYATNFDAGTIGVGILAPGPFFYCLIIRLVQECRYKKRTGRWIKEKNSRVMDPEGKLIWSSLIPILANVLTNGGYLCVLSLGWKFAKASGMNQGVISTLLSLASLMNIVAFYFKFGEKISCLHFIGVALMIACIVCISSEAASKKKDDESFDSDDTMGLNQMVAGILAICCGVVGAILMSTKHMFVRLYKKNYSGLDQGIDGSMVEFFCLSFFLIPLSQEINIGWSELLIGSVAGILICTGRICISIGVSVGLAGPAQSLMSTHALHQAFWSAMVAGQALSLMQLLGLMFGLLGVTSISFFDHLNSKMKLKRQIENTKSQESADLKKEAAIATGGATTADNVQ